MEVLLYHQALENGKGFLPYNWHEEPREGGGRQGVEFSLTV